MTKDLGTYYLRVEFKGGDGYIQRWDTAHRYTNGMGNEQPLDASYIPPTYESEQELFDNMEWMYLQGNYSCDCNKKLFLATSRQEECLNDECGDTMEIEKLTAIRPDRTEKVLYP